MASRVFRGCRAMLAAASKSKTASLSTKKGSSAASTAAVSVAKKPKAVRSAATGSGLLKPYSVSPALGDFMGGVSTASRAEAVKKVWEHIKANNLQDSTNRKVIHCDVKLKTIFEGKDEVGFQEIAKLLSAHFVKTPGS